METGTSSDPVPKHIPAELRTAPSFPGNKTKFLPLNLCNGDHVDKKNPQADVYPWKDNSYSIDQKVL